MPQFIVRHSLIIGITAGTFALGFNPGAAAAMLASAAAVWIAVIGQMIVLNRCLGSHIEPGPKAYDFRGWLAISLPICWWKVFICCCPTPTCWYCSLNVLAFGKRG